MNHPRAFSAYFVPNRSVNSATPAASDTPLCTSTDKGCKVIDRPNPPTSAFAPAPTAAVACAVTPT